MESRALGKGLSALIPQRAEESKGEMVAQVKVAQIKENSLQPRSYFDDEKLGELIASIKEKGVLQPLLVRPNKGGGYELIAGERRFRAARALDLDEVPVIIKDVNDQEALVIALVENIQRQELNAIEEAHAFKRLLDEFKLTQDAVAQSVGKERSTIANTLRLLKLPSEIQERVSDGSLSMGHARVLVGIEDSHVQAKLFEQTLKKNLSVRELENLARVDSKKVGKSARESVASKENFLVFMEEDLQRTLGTKVRIVAAKKRGKIIVEYYSSEDLERIVEIIKR